MAVLMVAMMLVLMIRLMTGRMMAMVFFAVVVVVMAFVGAFVVPVLVVVFAHSGFSKSLFRGIFSDTDRSPLRPMCTLYRQTLGMQILFITTYSL